MSKDQPWTVARLLEWTTDFLAGKLPPPGEGRSPKEAARLDAQLLLAHVLGCTRTYVLVRFAEEPDEATRTRFRDLVKRRVAGESVARLLGRKEFFSLDFEVNGDVLIPRSDSETLVTECLALLKGKGEASVLDVGTGSGCLAIAVAKNHKAAAVTAIDVSTKALATAKHNAERLKVSDRVRFVESDLFAGVTGEAFDVIISNPPYIRTADLSGIAAEVAAHEPRLALDGGPDGFAVIDRLVRDAPGFLRPGGALLFEIGYDQEEDARARLAPAEHWEDVRTIRDGAGHPRVIRATYVPKDAGGQEDGD